MMAQALRQSTTGIIVRIVFNTAKRSNDSVCSLESRRFFL
jgi:hypothetical protein